MSDSWFTSDTHFGHFNILQYTGRPWTTSEEMDEALIENWNSVVKDTDTIYHLGDFAYWRKYDPTPVVERLNGHIHLVLGNHDHDLLNWPFVEIRFESATPYKEIRIGKQDIILCHYAFRVWNKSHWGSWSLYGHSHGTLPDDPQALSMDVGVDTHWAHRPYHFDEIQEHMSKKDYVPIDGHK